MLIIVGFIIVTLSVIGGYLGSHGKLGALWQPFELVIIGGAALGAFMASNPTKVVKGTISATLSVFKGAKYKSSDYLDVLTLIHEMLNKARRDGFMSLEEHIENPTNSPLFHKYLKILADHHLLDFLTE